MAGKYILTKYRPTEVCRSTQMPDDETYCNDDYGDPNCASGRGVGRSRSFGTSKTKFVQVGPKRSYSSVNLRSTQSCEPEYDEPTYILNTPRSCESSPHRGREPHCHETQTIVELGEDSDHVHYRNLNVSPNYQHESDSYYSPVRNCLGQKYYPARNRYFNALDAAASIRSALRRTSGSDGCCQRSPGRSAAVREGSQGGMCVSNNRRLQRLRMANPTPQYYSGPSLVEPRCEEDLPQGLATVLHPTIPGDMEFRYQKRAPRGLSAVVGRSCVDNGQQTVEHCASSSYPIRDSMHQHETVTSSYAPNNARVVTNIEVLEHIDTPPDFEDRADGADSACSRTSAVKVETTQMHPDAAQIHMLEKQQQQLDALQQQLQGQQMQNQLQGQQQQQLHALQHQLQDLHQDQQLTKHKRLLMDQQQQLREQQQQLNELQQLQLRQKQAEEAELGAHDLLRAYTESIAPSNDSFSDHNCDPEFPPTEPPLLTSSSWEPAKSRRTISTYREPELMTASSMSEIPHVHRRREVHVCSGKKGGGVNFSQNTIDRICSSPGCATRSTSHASSLKNASTSCGNSMIKAMTEVSEPKTLRSIVKHAVQHAVQQQQCMQTAVKKAVRQELQLRSSDTCPLAGATPYGLGLEDESEGEESSDRSFQDHLSPPSTSNELDKARTTCSLTPEEQNSIAELVTSAARKSRSSSRSKSRSRRHSSSSRASSSNSSYHRGGPGQRGSKSEPVGMSYRDRMTSITQLLNSMNSVTQLLNSMPVQPDPATVAPGSFSQFPGQVAPGGYGPNGMPIGFDPNNPQGSFMGLPNPNNPQAPGMQGSFMGLPNPNNPQLPGMPGSFMGFDPNFPGQQLRSQSMPMMGYNPAFPQQARSLSMPPSYGRQGSFSGPRRSISRRRSSVSGRRRSSIRRNSVSNTESEQDNSIPEEDEVAEEESTGGDSGEATEGQDEGETNEGMAANCQSAIQSQKLEQMPQLSLFPERSSNGSLQTDMAKPNMPNEFQNHLSNMDSHIPQQFETQTYAKKSLSPIVEAMLQELEVLECMSRQKSAAYALNSSESIQAG